jgi:uncharacterized protein
MLLNGLPTALFVFTVVACATTTHHEQPPVPSAQPTTAQASGEQSSAAQPEQVADAPVGATVTGSAGSAPSKTDPQPAASGDNSGAESGSVGIANPASENCIKQGGKVVIEKHPDGEVGICVFPDGSRCEEWALLRGQCKRGQQK